MDSQTLGVAVWSMKNLAQNLTNCKNPLLNRTAIPLQIQQARHAKLSRLSRGYITVILRLHRDNGKENGKCYNGVIQGFRVHGLRVRGLGVLQGSADVEIGLVCL